MYCLKASVLEIIFTSSSTNTIFVFRRMLVSASSVSQTRVARKSSTLSSDGGVSEANIVGIVIFSLVQMTGVVIFFGFLYIHGVV